jgi:hypothetical protein
MLGFSINKIKNKNSGNCTKTINEKTVIVVFSGGMGAQIFSAAIYFNLKLTGAVVYADLSYFDIEPIRATEGEIGKCSYWAWELDVFGLPINSFEQSKDKNNNLYIFGSKLKKLSLLIKNLLKLKSNNLHIIRDGLEKLSLAVKALSKPEIAGLFKIPYNHNCENFIKQNYLCVHIRRGDYLNVASHVISDSVFIKAIKPLRHLLDQIVVISDSNLEKNFKSQVSVMFKITSFMDNVDVATAHVLMRRSTILICSNSQFSLSAALLNPDKLIIIPKQWFGGKHKALEKVIEDECSFQIMNC